MVKLRCITIFCSSARRDRSHPAAEHFENFRPTGNRNNVNVIRTLPGMAYIDLVFAVAGSAKVLPESAAPRLLYTRNLHVGGHGPNTNDVTRILISSADKFKLHNIVCIECIDPQHEHRTSPPSRRTYTALSALC
jgi:hypothetical protein